MKESYQSQRSALLRQMAELDAMELGSLKAEFRSTPSGAQSGPYFKHQVWKDGANQSLRVSADDAPALELAINNRVKFEELAQSYVNLTVQRTRQNYLPDTLKKKIAHAFSPKRPSSQR